MEKATIIGMSLGIIGVFVGMVLKGAPLSSLVNPAAFLIIGVGTAGAVFNAFTTVEMKLFPKVFKKLFRKQELPSKIELIKMFIELSQTARREGILALEGRLEEITEPFFRDGLRMVIDGMDPDFVQDVMDADIHMMEERHRMGALLFSQAGMYAPTLGVLGAVIGLIAALGNLADIEQLGHAIAAAFVATMLGIFSGYVMWHPFSNKLKVISKSEVEIKRMIVEGILSLQAGDSPIAIEAKMMAYISLTERLEFNKEKGQMGGAAPGE